MSDINIIQVSDEKVSLEKLNAINALSTGRIPPSAIMTRPGASGRQIPYVEHTWATKQMNAAFGNLWSFEVLTASIDPNDGSAVALCKMTLKILWNESEFIERTITEVGSFEAYQMTEADPYDKTISKPATHLNGSPKYTMNAADRIASAASRGLVKCLFRAFNLGSELISKQPEKEITAKDVWNSLYSYAKRNGVEKEELTNALKEADITAEKLVEQFAEAYKITYNLIKNVTEEELPDTL